MNSSLHGSCKFTKFYLIHANDNRGKGGSNEVSRHNNKFIQIVWFDMKHITFSQIQKPPGNVIWKMQMGEGRGSKQIDAMLSNEGRADAPFI